MKIIALGNDSAGDDGAALLAAKALASADRYPVVFAGRPGAGLLDLLDSAGPVVLLDVVSGGGPPGRIIRLTFAQLVNGISPAQQVSSHGFGPAEVLQLGRALGRSLPKGCFIGIEGGCFEPGNTLSPAVERAMGRFIDTVSAAVGDLTHW